MKLFFVRGGTYDYLDVTRFGWLYGIRSDYTACDTVHFLDFNFERRYDFAYWQRHEQRALELRPMLTMIPDWFADTSEDWLFGLHERLTNAGLRTMWTPKQHGITHRIPADAVIGVSVPTSYAGFLPKPQEVIGRELHLLGGHPDHQKYLTHQIYPLSKVVSVDGNALAPQAFLGKYWSQDGKWIQTHKTWTTRMLRQQSARNIRDYLASNTMHFNKRRMRLIHMVLMDIAYVQPRLFAEAA